MWVNLLRGAFLPVPLLSQQVLTGNWRNRQTSYRSTSKYIFCPLVVLKKPNLYGILPIFKGVGFFLGGGEGKEGLLNPNSFLPIWDQFFNHLLLIIYKLEFRSGFMHSGSHSSAWTYNAKSGFIPDNLIEAEDRTMGNKIKLYQDSQTHPKG